MPESEEIDGGRAARKILDAYEECLQVRQQWLSMHDNDVGDTMMELLHRRLNAAVKSYYEAMFYHLRNEDAVSEHWEERELWTKREAKTTEDGRYVLDENNQPVVVEQSVCGLKQLQGAFNQTEIKQETVKDAFGERTITREVNKKLPVEVLFDVSRVLDEAADEMGLLADVDAKSHRSEIPDELMEDVKKWEEENLK